MSAVRALVWVRVGVLLVGGACSGGAGVPGDAPWVDPPATDTGGTGDSTTDTADTGCTVRVWYVDLDGDGFGTDDRTWEACDAPASAGGIAWTAQDGDCDPRDPTIHPGAPERCDGVDSDCAQGGTATDERDTDRDGVRACEDCDDRDRDVAPGRTETCDGVDQDCDGVVDDGALDATVWYTDADGDGHGVPGAVASACEAPAGTAAWDDDCDDADPAVAPGLEDGDGDGVDDDCDGYADEGTVDLGAWPCDRTVPGSDGTIQGAIDAALAGDVICVGPGGWYETLDFGGKDVTVWGVLGAATTTIDAAGADVAVRFESGETDAAVLRGFTVTGGEPLWGEGGGIRVVASTPTLEDLIVRGNRSSMYGGGVYVEGGSPALTRVRVADNALTYTHDGAAYGWGGGLYFADSDAVLEDVVVEGNASGEGGGGIAAWESRLSLGHVLVRDNSAGRGGGGGVYVYGGALALTNGVIMDNVVADAGWGPGSGGGLRARAGAVTFTHVVLAGNDADGDGGGAVATEGATLSLVNTIVVDGAAGGSGGGVYVGDASVVVLGTDVWGNIPDAFAGVDDPSGMDGNLCLDPAFTGLWSLPLGSALTDAGTGAGDPDGSAPDIGAFGGVGAAGWDLDGDGVGAWWRPGPYDPASGLDCDDLDATVAGGSGC